MINGIDLTTFAGDITPPANKDHPIYNYPSHSDFPRMDLSNAELSLKVHLLELRMKEIEQWMAQQ